MLAVKPLARSVFGDTNCCLVKTLFSLQAFIYYAGIIFRANHKKRRLLMATLINVVTVGLLYFSCSCAFGTD